MIPYLVRLALQRMRTRAAASVTRSPLPDAQHSADMVSIQNLSESIRPDHVIRSRDQVTPRQGVDHARAGL